MRADRELPCESHEEFRELCALAASDGLEAEEWQRLVAHLKGCSDCRDVLGQYETLIKAIIPRLTPIPTSAQSPEDFASDWCLEEAEALLFARLNEDCSATERKERPSAPQSQVGKSSSIGLASPRDPWAHIWWQYAAGWALVACLGFAVYRSGVRHGEETTPRQTASASPSKRQSTEAPVEQSGVQQTSRVDEQIVELRSQLSGRLREIAHLKAQQAQMAEQLSDEELDRERLSQDRVEVVGKLDGVESELQSEEQKLALVASQKPEEDAHVAELEQKVSELTATVRERSEEVARDEELLDHDRDIRELMGSRDLCIAEVYDVAGNGRTQKPFGRVFYTKGKSLIFYAYDLDKQPGVATASTFQAWGSQGGDRNRAVNLGIFFQDEANRKRWVVKSDEPETLAHIDAVFVTVEPRGGSAHPSTKPLLFADLRVQPNHP